MWTTTTEPITLPLCGCARGNNASYLRDIMDWVASASAIMIFIGVGAFVATVTSLPARAYNSCTLLRNGRAWPKSCDRLLEPEPAP